MQVEERESTSVSVGPDEELHERIRRRVRRQVRFLRHLAEFVVIGGFFFFIDWVTGGEGSGINWAQWITGIWAFFLFVEFWSAYVTPKNWWQGLEERWVEREMQRRTGRR